MSELSHGYEATLTDLSFEEAVARVPDALKEQGFGVKRIIRSSEKWGPVPSRLWKMSDLTDGLAGFLIPHPVHKPRQLTDRR